MTYTTNDIYSAVQLQSWERVTYPICLLVEGAWVMTELDWGEGSACWITMLLSWLDILEWVCWCWLGPPCPWRVIFCSETDRRRRKWTRGKINRIIETLNYSTRCSHTGEILQHFMDKKDLLFIICSVRMYEAQTEVTFNWPTWPTWIFATDVAKSVWKYLSHIMWKSTLCAVLLNCM